MKFGALLSSATGQCVAATVFVFACCPLILAIREARENSAPRAPAHESDRLNLHAKPAVSSAAANSNRSANHAYAYPVAGRTDSFQVKQDRKPLNFQVRLTRLPQTSYYLDGSDGELTEESVLVRPSRVDLSRPGSSLDPTGANYSRKDSLRSSAGTKSKQFSDPLETIRRLGPTSSHDYQPAIASAVQRAQREIERAFALANKGATFSARKQLELSLRTIADSLDAFHRVHAHSECLSAGLLAIQESIDFHGGDTSPARATFVAMKHRSGIIPEGNPEELDCTEAMREYFSFAEQRLAASAGNIAVASEALYGLGKLAMAHSTEARSYERYYNLRAMVLFQTALQIHDGNYSASNELGVLLARDGRLHEARKALQLSIAVKPLPETWQNLAIVHERLGELEQAQRSRIEWQRATQTARQLNPTIVTASNGSSVYWVDKSTFERGTTNPYASEGSLR